MKQLDILIPGDIETPTGGYIYDRRIADGLRDLGWGVRVHELDASFPRPSPRALAHASETLGRIASGGLVMIDGLAAGAMPEQMIAESERLRLVALVHHPLALETGLAPESARALDRAERASLAVARRVVTTSTSTAALVHALGVARDRIDVVEPGTDPAPLSLGSGSSALNLLCVATLTARKGHALLLDALAQLTHLDWRLTCAGSLTRSPATVEALRRQLERLALEEWVSLVGEVDTRSLADLYRRADVFVLATYFEGYGMALSDAIAHGLPIVSARAGAVTETVPEGAGLLVPPGDSGALAVALGRVMEDANLRQGLARGAQARRTFLPTWWDSSRRMEQALLAALR